MKLSTSEAKMYKPEASPSVQLTKVNTHIYLTQDALEQIFLYQDFFLFFFFLWRAKIIQYCYGSRAVLKAILHIPSTLSTRIHFDIIILDLGSSRRRKKKKRKTPKGGIFKKPVDWKVS